MIFKALVATYLVYETGGDRDIVVNTIIKSDVLIFKDFCTKLYHNLK